MGEYQVFLNWAFIGAFGLIGWIAGRITKTLDKLDEDVRQMPEKYVLKADFALFVDRLEGAFKDSISSLEQKIDRVHDRLDGKADK